MPNPVKQETLGGTKVQDLEQEDIETRRLIGL